jgi:hypothetical protein
MEKSVEDEFTLGPRVQATLVHMATEKETVLLLSIISDHCQANCCREECSLCKKKTIVSQGSYTCIYTVYASNVCQVVKTSFV